MIASALLLSSISWAGNSSCATPQQLSSYGSTAAVNGCYEVDQTFSNLNVASTAGSSITQSMSTVDISGSSNWSSRLIAVDQHRNVLRQYRGQHQGALDHHGKLDVP